MNHLVALTKDCTVKASDKQKLKGYIKVWKNPKVLLGCAVFAKILKLVGILGEVLQNQQNYLYESIESVVKTKKSLEIIKATPFRQFPFVKKVINRTRYTHSVHASCTYIDSLAYWLEIINIKCLPQLQINKCNLDRNE